LKNGETDRGKEQEVWESATANRKNMQFRTWIHTSQALLFCCCCC